MKMNIELARATDVNEIEALYGAVVDDLLANVNYPGWKKGIYPTRDEAIFGIEYADELAKNNGVKTIRLDVRKGNVPAIKLYERCGYTYVGAINLDFRGSDLGLFELYEKII